MITKRPATCPSGGALFGRKTDKIVELVDESGNILGYECAQCGRSGESFHRIVGHLSSHQARPRKAKKEPATGFERFIVEHARLKAQNERLTSRLKKERAARVKAERRLAQIDRLFAPLN